MFFSAVVGAFSMWLVQDIRSPLKPVPDLSWGALDIPQPAKCVNVDDCLGAHLVVLVENSGRASATNVAIRFDKVPIETRVPGIFIASEMVEGGDDYSLSLEIVPKSELARVDLWGVMASDIRAVTHDNDIVPRKELDDIGFPPVKSNLVKGILFFLGPFAFVAMLLYFGGGGETRTNKVKKE